MELVRMRRLYGLDLVSGLPVLKINNPEKIDKRWENAVAVIFENGEPVIPLFSDPKNVAEAVGGIDVVDEQELTLDEEFAEKLRKYGLDRDYITQWNILWNEGWRGGIAGGVSEVFVLTLDGKIEILYRNF